MQIKDKNDKNVVLGQITGVGRGGGFIFFDKLISYTWYMWGFVTMSVSPFQNSWIRHWSDILSFCVKSKADVL